MKISRKAKIKIFNKTEEILKFRRQETPTECF